MSIGQIHNEGDLAAFIRRQLERSDLHVLVQQIQNGLAAARAHGPYAADSGAVASGTESALITVAHDIGAVPSKLAFAYLDDGSWSHQFGWRATLGASDVQFRFFNLGPNAGQAILTYWLIP